MSELNVEQITQLIAALEQDLAKLPNDTPGAQRLRDEVAALKNAVGADVNAGLHGVRAALNEVAVDGIKVSDYVTRIGNMLGI